MQLGGKYAHAITTELLSCTDERDVLNVLTGSITSRFSFYEEKGGEKVLTPYSAHLQANTGGFTLKANTELQDFSLADSVNNQLYNSGLFALLYKVDSVFGAGSSEKLMKFLLKRYQTNYTPNRKHKQWVKEYKPLYTKQFKTYINWEYDQLYKLK